MAVDISPFQHVFGACKARKFTLKSGIIFDSESVLPRSPFPHLSSIPSFWYVAIVKLHMKRNLICPEYAEYISRTEKMRSSRPSTLSMDLNLYSYAVNDGIRSTILEPASYNQMSQKNGNDVNCKYHQRQQRRQQQHSKSTSTATSHHCCRGNVCSKNYNWSWLNDASNQNGG